MRVLRAIPADSQNYAHYFHFFFKNTLKFPLKLPLI